MAKVEGCNKRGGQAIRNKSKVMMDREPRALRLGGQVSRITVEEQVSLNVISMANHIHISAMSPLPILRFM